MWFDPYAVSPAELIEEFQKALMKARDAHTEKDAAKCWQHSSYLANAMMARMKGLTPNIRPNDVVCQSDSDWRPNAAATMVMCESKTAVVARVWCGDDGVWSLGFASLPFDMTAEACCFKLLPKEKAH